MPGSAGDPYVGQLALFPYNFVPANWYACDGSLVPIFENETLFNLIGTTSGGDGQSTCAVPDLRGRAPLHMGTGPGLTTRILGESGGSETVTLTTTQLPAHSHAVLAGAGQMSSHPANAYVGGDGQFGPASGSFMQPIGSSGGSQPHGNMQPFLVMTWCISAFGVYPSTT